ncbi:hypothetical protein SAMN04515666_10847 [Bosea lupini]|uniref:Uncharacterized protein n=1 Tax=Bosea lupini TaxID=1036779 RepID=A0A1H7W7G0_9HYPH|nr:hypothetical protein SAMN04515666_10847 [Bosea lupini]
MGTVQSSGVGTMRVWRPKTDGVRLAKRLWRVPPSIKIGR